MGSLCCRCYQDWSQLTMTSRPKRSRTRGLSTELARMASTWSNQIFWPVLDPFQGSTAEMSTCHLTGSVRPPPVAFPPKFPGNSIAGLIRQGGEFAFVFPPHLHLEVCSDQATTSLPHQSAFSSTQPRPSRFLGNLKRLFIYFVPGNVWG